MFINFYSFYYFIISIFLIILTVLDEITCNDLFALLYRDKKNWSIDDLWVNQQLLGKIVSIDLALHININLKVWNLAHKNESFEIPLHFLKGLEPLVRLTQCINIVMHMFRRFEYNCYTEI